MITVNLDSNDDDLYSGMSNLFSTAGGGAASTAGGSAVGGGESVGRVSSNNFVEEVLQGDSPLSASDVRPRTALDMLSGLVPGVQDLHGADVLLRDKSKKISFSATANRMLNLQDVTRHLTAIFEATDTKGSFTSEAKLALLQAVCLAYFKNGGSVLNEARAEFTVSFPSVSGDVETHSFNYHKHVVEVVGEDLRRLFRELADVVRQVVRTVLHDTAGSRDPVAVRNRRDIYMVAYDRNLSQHPDLAFDAADACTDLTISERLAVAGSKAVVTSRSFDAVGNMVVPQSGGSAPPSVVPKLNAVSRSGGFGGAYGGGDKSNLPY